MFLYRMWINLVVIDVLFGVGWVWVYIDISEGQLRFDLGELEWFDMTITTDYEIVCMVFVMQDQQVVMQVFMVGRVKVQGDMIKLMFLQMVMFDERARSVVVQFKVITAQVLEFGLVGVIFGRGWVVIQH